jgi:hypothetical protein
LVLGIREGSLVIRWLLATLAVIVSLASPAAALSSDTQANANLDHNAVSGGMSTNGPGSSVDGALSSSPIVSYVNYELTQDRSANTGDLNGLCFVGNDPTKPGFTYVLVGTTASGTVVDQRWTCVLFTEPGVKPAPPPVPQLPTFDEVWKSAQLPQPSIVTDPATRGITGLETRVSAEGERTRSVVLDLRGYHLVVTAYLDHFTISVDGGPAVTADHDTYMFETKGNHTITIGAVWKGEATLTGPGITTPIHLDDIGSATLTMTRNYPVHEIRSVLQP